MPYTVNPRLVRGLDYYTRTTFEFTVPPSGSGLGTQNALLGGGRYDGLSEMLGGPKAPGIGFAIGEDRLILTLQAQAANPRTRTSNLEPPKLDAYIAPMGWSATPPRSPSPANSAAPASPWNSATEPSASKNPSTPPRSRPPHRHPRRRRTRHLHRHRQNLRHRPTDQGCAGTHSCDTSEMTNQGRPHPYREFEGASEWAAIEHADANLVKNKDLRGRTPRIAWSVIYPQLALASMK